MLFFGFALRGLGLAPAVLVVVLVTAWDSRYAGLRSSLLLSIGLLATWSFAGHSRSMRWPALGVPVDIVHHGAAAAWLGGLTINGAIWSRLARGSTTGGAGVQPEAVRGARGTVRMEDGGVRPAVQRTGGEDRRHPHRLDRRSRS